MVIESDVAAKAAKWNLDPHLVQAVVQAEGGGNRIVKAVQCSLPNVKTRDAALDVLCKSIVHRMMDLVSEKYSFEFVEYFGSKWAPLNVENDPNNLNRNWIGNVLKLWGKV